MKAFKFVNGLLVLLIVFSGLVVISCKKTQTAENQRLKKDRGITIVNNIGNLIKGYSVNAGVGGPEIKKGTDFTEQRIYLLISDSWKNDPNLEVILIDKYDNVYKNNVNVPLEGNTDIHIGKEHKVPQGSFTDNINKLKEWFDKHK